MLMVKDPTSAQLDKVASRKWQGRSRLAWLGVVLLLVIVIVGTVAGALVIWQRPSATVVSLPTPSPTFVPKVGDVGDVDDGVTVALGEVPSFQFKSGGYTLSGLTLDARRAGGGVSIWITVPPVLWQRTAPE